MGWGIVIILVIVIFAVGAVFGWLANEVHKLDLNLDCFKLDDDANGDG